MRKNLPTLTRIGKEKPEDRVNIANRKNLLTQWKLRRKTDPKLELLAVLR